MPNQGLYDLLLGALQEERRREFTEPDLAVATPRLDPNFRQLSSAPFVQRAHLVSKSLQQPNGEDGRWPAPSGDATPIRAGLLRDAITRLPFPGPPPSSDPSSTAPPPGARELWNLIRPLWEMYQESRPGAPAPRPSDRSSRPDSMGKRLPDRLDERKDTVVGPIDELHQAGKKKGPLDIRQSPPLAPDPPDEASDSSDEDTSRPSATEADCEKEEQEAIAFCMKAQRNGWKGYFGMNHIAEPRNRDWDRRFRKCVKGQMSPQCGGYPIK